MAFPVVAGTASSTESNASSHTVSLPGSISAGDLLIVVFCGDANADTVSWPAGWNEILDYESASSVTLAIAWREADGTEGATITVTTAGTDQSAHQAFRITGAVDPDTQPPEISTVADGLSTAVDPGSLTPTGGAKDYLWLACEGHDKDNAITPYPTNYTDGTETAVATHVGMSTARRELNASSEDPGAFTMAAADNWIAVVVAVHPTAGGGGTILPFMMEYHGG